MYKRQLLLKQMHTSVGAMEAYLIVAGDNDVLSGAGFDGDERVPLLSLIHI